MTIHTTFCCKKRSRADSIGVITPKVSLPAQTVMWFFQSNHNTTHLSYFTNAIKATTNSSGPRSEQQLLWQCHTTVLLKLQKAFWGWTTLHFVTCPRLCIFWKVDHSKRLDSIAKSTITFLLPQHWCHEMNTFIPRSRYPVCQQCDSSKALTIWSIFSYIVNVITGARNSSASRSEDLFLQQCHCFIVHIMM